MKVFIYSFEGKYSGSSEYEFTEPKGGNIHKCMLFLAQEGIECEFNRAENEISKFGFKELSTLKGTNLKVESLNTEGGKKFTPYYEEAIEKGSSLVWYPNT